MEFSRSGDIWSCRLLKKIFLLTSLTCTCFIFAQDSLNVRFVGGYPYGQYWFSPNAYMSKQSAMVAAMINNHRYLFATSGSSIIIFNVDDPSNPVVVGKILSPIKLYPFLVDTLLYTTAINRGLRIYNVSNPAQPVEIGSCACSEWIWTLFVEDSIAFAAGPNRLTIFNVADPTAPHIIGTWTPTPSDASLHYVFVQEDYAYITAERPYPYTEGLLFIVDITQPANPLIVGTCSDLDNLRKVKVRGRYAYVIDLSGLNIIDVSDPYNPYLLEFYSVFTPIDIALLDDYAYCASFAGVRVVDISNPSAPFLVGSAYEGSEYAITLLDSIAYCIVSDGVSVFDVSEPLLPFKISQYPMMTDIQRIKVINNLVVASSWYKPAIGTIDVTVPQNCIGMDVFEINHYYDCWTPEIDGHGNYAYATALDSGLRILDISAPANITEAGHLVLPGAPVVLAVFVQDNYAYIAAYYGYAFTIVNVTDPQNPYVMSWISPNSIYDIFVLDDYAYCAAGDGLQIINVANPLNPYAVARCSVTTYASAVFASGNYAYLYDDPNNCLWIIDVSDPYHPFVANQYPNIGVGGMFVSGNYLFLGSVSFGEGLKILDVSDPTNYQEVGYYKTPYIWIDDVIVVDDYIYLATFDMGLWILQYYNLGVSEQYTHSVHDKISLSTIGNRIKFSYVLGQHSPVRISLIDVCGRTITRSVIDEPAGIHKKEITNANIPAGIYFLRIETNEWISTNKVILVK